MICSRNFTLISCLRLFDVVQLPKAAKHHCIQSRRLNDNNFYNAGVRHSKLYSRIFPAEQRHRDNSSFYLIDEGDGIRGRIVQARDEMKIAAFAMSNLTRLFLTHLHPDHTNGLPGLIIGPWVLMRKAPLHIHRPRGLKKLVTGILEAYETGIAEHRDGLAPVNHPLEVIVHEIEAGEIYSDKNIKVVAFPVSHGGLETYGYRFESPDRIIVHFGDTCPQKTLIDHARGCDLLIHEVYCAASLEAHTPAWQTYHRTMHTSSVELANMANDIIPKLPILNHQLIWGDMSEADLLEEIKAIYKGKVISGHHLLVC